MMSLTVKKIMLILVSQMWAKRVHGVEGSDAAHKVRGIV